MVFDAGALIALAKLEPGALVVRQLLRAHAGSCYIHAVNLLEIHYSFERDKDLAYAIGPCIIYNDRESIRTTSAEKHIPWSF